MPRDTIRSLAKEIKQRWPELVVVVTPWMASTDRKVGRLRSPGKGRKGTRLEVYRPLTPKERKLKPFKTGELLLDHRNSETYRRVSDVREWMEKYARAADDK